MSQFSNDVLSDGADTTPVSSTTRGGVDTVNQVINQKTPEELAKEAAAAANAANQQPGQPEKLLAACSTTGQLDALRSTLNLNPDFTRKCTNPQKAVRTLEYTMEMAVGFFIGKMIWKKKMWPAVISALGMSAIMGILRRVSGGSCARIINDSN